MITSRVTVWQDLQGNFHAVSYVPERGGTISDAWRLAHDAIREAWQATGAFAIRSDGAPRFDTSLSMGAYVMYRWRVA